MKYIKLFEKFGNDIKDVPLDKVKELFQDLDILGLKVRVKYENLLLIDFSKSNVVKYIDLEFGKFEDLIYVSIEGKFDFSDIKETLLFVESYMYSEFGCSVEAVQVGEDAASGYYYKAIEDVDDDIIRKFRYNCCSITFIKY